MFEGGVDFLMKVGGGEGLVWCGECFVCFVLFTKRVGLRSLEKSSSILKC